jgi:predicted nuclease of predicted toxin-antitoxin system
LTVRLLIDECIQAKLLVAKLVAAGHDVQTALQAGLIGDGDDAVFAAAIANNRIVLTINCVDFISHSLFRSMNRGFSTPAYCSYIFKTIPPTT